MVGPGHCPMISKYGPSLSKVVGPVNPLFLVVKKSHFNKNVYLTASLQKAHVGCQYSKICLKQPLKKRQNKNLNKKYSTSGIVCLLLLPISRPQRSLGHSLFKQKFSQSFCVFLVFCCFCFFILSKFPN